METIKANDIGSVVSLLAKAGAKKLRIEIVLDSNRNIAAIDLNADIMSALGYNRLGRFFRKDLLILMNCLMNRIKARETRRKRAKLLLRTFLWSLMLVLTNWLLKSEPDPER
jgi:hypothetical protein